MESSFFTHLLDDFKMKIPTNWTHTQEAQVLQPYTYLYSNPGKDIRSTLIQAFNAWAQVEDDKLSIVLQAVEMLHTASLLIDDVEDRSELRRGQMAAHLKFGEASTINAANYVYFSAMALLRSTHNDEVISIYEEEILNLHRGQGLELYWRDTCGRESACPTQEEYIGMVNNKTGGLLRMAIRLMQALSIQHHGRQKCHDLVPLANMVGILFQIRDDYMNLASTQYCREKGFCEDLTEGKFSFPIIHGILYRGPRSARLAEILMLKTDDVGLKMEACEILRTSGSLEYTVKVVNQLDATCRQEIEQLGGNAELVKILERLRISGDGSEISETIALAAGQQQAKSRIESLLHCEGIKAQKSESINAKASYGMMTSMNGSRMMAGSNGLGHSIALA